MMKLLNKLRAKFSNSIKYALMEGLKDPYLRSTFIEILKDPEVKQCIWIAANETPSDVGHLIGNQIIKSGNIQKTLFDIANKQSAIVVLEKMPEAGWFASHTDLLVYCLNKAKPLDGLVLEFGVYQGSTINIISSNVTADKKVHGFDSFQGLPENWTGGGGKGAYSTNGQLPSVNANVELHVGLFEDSLPGFLEKNKEDVAFLHIDSDIYVSAKTVFTHLKGRIKKGTIILFDEFFNYPGFQDHEYKAFFEFIEESGLPYKFIAYNTDMFQAAVEIL